MSRTIARALANASILGAFASLGAACALGGGHPSTLGPTVGAALISATLALIAPAFATIAESRKR